MEESSSKRTKVAADNSLKQIKALPLLCVEAICRCTPTSKLVRLYSTVVPLPGADWNSGLEAVLKKRRPFSISEDPAYHRTDFARTDALFDSSGAKIATVKHPEAFQFFPLCEFVQSVAIPFRVLPAYAAAEARLRYVIAGESLLPHLRNITNLTLIDLGNLSKPYPSKFLDHKNALLPSLKELLPQLESFAIEQRHGQRLMLSVALMEMLPEMAVLKRLDIPPLRFGTLMRAATAGSQASEALWRSLSGLNSVQLRQIYFGGSPSGITLQLLGFMSHCCTHLTQLAVTVDGEFKPYLVALRALPSLTTLDLELDSIKTTGMTFGENEAIHSVLELRLVEHVSWNQASRKRLIASLFPNVTVAVVQYEAFAWTQVWPKLERVTYYGDYRVRDYPMTEFLASPNLPCTVDLSPIRNEVLARNSSLLTAIYKAMQNGAVETLLLRGPVHGEALPRLQWHINFTGDNAKVTVWKDRDLGEQTGFMCEDNFFVSFTDFSAQTDVRIVGTKENGEKFTIRVVHQHTKMADIFH